MMRTRKIERADEVAGAGPGTAVIVGTANAVDPGTGRGAGVPGLSWTNYVILDFRSFDFGSVCIFP